MNKISNGKKSFSIEFLGPTRCRRKKLAHSGRKFNPDNELFFENKSSSEGKPKA